MTWSSFPKARAQIVALSAVIALLVPIAPGPTGTQRVAAAVPSPSRQPDVVAPLITHGSANGPALRVRMPERISEGEPVAMELEAVGVRDLAGYELLLTFDRSAAEFAGTEGINEAFAGTRRYVAPLGPVETADGVWLGLYSCPVEDCVTARGTRRAAGASGTVNLGRVRLLPSRSGELEVRISAVRLVDSRGRSIDASVPVDPMAVRVAGGPPVRIPARNPAVRLGDGSIDRAGPPDVTLDGGVSHADVMEMAIAWQRSRTDRMPCDPAAELDVNRDGCTDVTDVQLVAADVSQPVLRRSGRRGAEAALSTGPAVSSDVTFASDVSTLEGGTFTVTSTGDQADSNPGDGVCATSSGCTLRAAITEANLRPGPDTITFAIAGTGVKRITLSSTLPTINDLTGPTTIDGYTQSGSSPNTSATTFNAVLNIELRGSTGTRDALFVTSPGNTVRGLAMFNMRLIVTLQGPGARNNRIVGNAIGTDAPGTYASPYVSGGNGVFIHQGAAFNLVGAPSLADRNLISGNANNGIRTWHERSDHNLIQNNLIGLGRTGLPLRNNAHGIDINAGSSYNLIGGTGTLERNVVSANLGEGIEFSHGTLTVNNRAIGNYIGTTVSGNGGAGAGYGNGLYGIKVEDGAINSLIASNVIGNNGFRTDDLGGGIGILGHYTAGTTVRDNRVGTGVSGQSIPNDESGILVYYYAAWNVIGPGNIVAHNPVGVEISSHPNKHNTITRNSIYGNSFLGINLQAGTGVSLNDGISDSDDGANGMLNYPVLSAATTTRASGTACAGCTVEVFIADRLTSDSGGGNYGQGRTFAGSGVAASDRSFSIALSGVATGNHLTATATDSLGNTSEFSLNMAVPTGSPPAPLPTPPPPDGTVIASDTFSRSLTDNWGAAPVGGAYAYFYCTAHHFDVNGSSGTFLVPDPASTEACPPQPELTVTKNRGAFLTDVSARDVNMLVRVRSSKAASGNNQNVYLTARRWIGGTEYRGQFRFTPTGQVWVQGARVVSDSMVSIGTNTRAVGATHAAGQDVWVRMEVSGTSPTTIRLKAWNPGSAEPSTWTTAVTDSQPELQRAGGVGVMAALSGGSNNGSVLFTFDDLSVTSTGSQPPPAAPVADFTWQQTAGTLGVQFSDTSTGSPTSWSWNFGDGTSSTAQNPSHSYAAAGTYQVTLTATNAGGSSNRTRSVTVDPLPPPGGTTTYAEDTFSRNQTDTWGNADTGGAYSYFGTQADFDVNGQAGTMRLPSAGNSRGAFLGSVSQRDVDLRFDVSLDRLPAAGSGVYVYGVVRQVASSTEYRAKLRALPSGQLRLSASRLVSNTETQLGSEIVVPGITYAAGTRLTIRARVTGTSPTTIELRVWRAGDPEPSSWMVATTDSSQALQSAGAVGLRAYASSASGNPPYVLSFDNLSVAAGE